MNQIIVVAVIAVAAFALILVPILKGRGAPTDASSDVPIEDEVLRYRDAVRANTVCPRCGQANPSGSRFCYECGRSLGATDAEEFDVTGEVG